MKIIYVFLAVFIACIGFASCLLMKIDVHEIVDEMPRFPGCDNVEGNDRAKQQCSLTKMYDWLYAQAKYSEVKYEDNPENNVFYTFIVDTLGNVTEPKMLVEKDNVYAQEGLHVLQEMANLPTKWTPGKHKGKLVKVRVHIALNFKMES